MSFVVAIVIKLKNESCVVACVCTSSREALAGWLVVVISVVGTVAVSPRLAAFGCFGCCLELFLAIFVRMHSFIPLS